MLADAGASYVILGHSERRADHGETDSAVRAKAEAAQAAGPVALTAVVRLRVDMIGRLQALLREHGDLVVCPNGSGSRPAGAVRVDGGGW